MTISNAGAMLAIGDDKDDKLDCVVCTVCISNLLAFALFFWLIL
jgi:hypothetical protein